MPRTGSRPVVLAAALACCLLAPGLACAATTGLTGVWLLDQHTYDRQEDFQPPLKPEAQVEAAARRAARDQGGKVLSDNNKLCLPIGMPGMVTNEFAMEFLETPGRVTVINESSSLTRTISLTRKTHNTDQDPGYAGDSIGHWEGKTLVVETTNLNDKSSHIPGVPNHGGTVKITERYHLDKGGKILVNDMTFENPEVLMKPWTVQYLYHRGEKDAELWEYVCQNDAPGWSERFKDDPLFKGPVARK